MYITKQIYTLKEMQSVPRFKEKCDACIIWQVGSLCVLIYHLQLDESLRFVSASVCNFK